MDLQFIAAAAAATTSSSSYTDGDAALARQLAASMHGVDTFNNRGSTIGVGGVGGAGGVGGYADPAATAAAAAAAAAAASAAEAAREAAIIREATGNSVFGHKIYEGGGFHDDFEEE
jgi:hypothetical protein